MSDDTPGSPDDSQRPASPAGGSGPTPGGGGDQRRIERLIGILGVLLLASSIAAVSVSSERQLRAENERLDPLTACRLDRDRVLIADVDKVVALGLADLALQDLPAPEPGSEDYQDIVQQAVDLLVDDLVWDRAARERGIVPDEEAIEAQWQQFVDEFHGGDEAAVEREAQELGIDLEIVRRFQAEVPVTRNTLFEQLAGDPTDAEVRRRYESSFPEGQWRRLSVASFASEEDAADFSTNYAGVDGVTFEAAVDDAANAPLPRELGAIEVAPGSPQESAGGGIVIVGEDRIDDGEVAAALFALEAGEASGVLEVGDAFIVARAVTAASADARPSLDEARDTVRRELRLERLERQVTDAELQERFDAQFPPTDRRLVLIATLEDEDAARSFAREQAGAAAVAFHAAAVSASTAERPEHGVEGFDLGRGEFAPELDEVVFDLEDGEVSEPIELSGTWMVVLPLEATREGFQPDIDEFREELLLQVGNERASDAIEQFERQMYERLGGRVTCLHDYEWQPPDLDAAPDMGGMEGFEELDPSLFEEGDFEELDLDDLDLDDLDLGDIQFDDVDAGGEPLDVIID